MKNNKNAVKQVTRSEQIMFRCTPKEKEWIQANARFCKTSVSQFILDQCINRDV
jgi:uncharacterized protein (DUF1778 family)